MDTADTEQTKGTNYKGKTNAELAQDFLDSMIRKEEKTARHFRILLAKYKAWDREGVDDLVNETIRKVFERILEAGFVDGYFQAYFERSLENNLLAHLSSQNRSFYTGPEPTTDDEEDEEGLAAYEEGEVAKMLFAFNQLSESGKEMLVMKMDKQRYRDIQKSLNLTIGQVKMRTRKARLEVIEYQKLYPVKTWEPIPGVAHYSVSRKGQVRCDITGTGVKARKYHGSNYLQVQLSPSGVGYDLHTLVYAAHGDTHELPGYIYHIDGDPQNNHIDNLAFEAWVEAETQD